MKKYDLNNINDPKSLAPVYKDIHMMLIKKEYDEVNTILKEIELEKVTILILMGLLRLTFAWKENIPYWKEHLINVTNELKRRDENYESILIGLI